MKIKTILLFGITASFLNSCGYWDKIKGKETNDEDDEKKILDPIDPLALTSSLQAFQTCNEVKEHIINKTLESLEREKKNQIEWILNPRRYDTVAEASPTAGNESAADSASSKSGPDTYTTTNNQVEGVEESDFIKNTGTHIYQLTGKYLRVVKSWPANEMAEIARLEFEGHPIEMLLNKDKLIVILNPILTPDEIKKRHYFSSYLRATNKVVIKIIDVKNPAKPKITNTYDFEGAYSNVRRVGNSIRLILRSSIQTSTNIEYAKIYDVDGKLEKISLLEENFAKNSEIIRTTNLNTFLGRIHNKLTPGELTDEKCQKIFAPSVETELGMTKIVTLNLENEAISESTLLARTGTIYASKESLYLTTSYYWWNFNSTEENKETTYIHKFSIKDPNSAPYLGSGAIPGSLLNQFSLDEYEGKLRLASTISLFKENRRSTYNQIFVMDNIENSLKIIGQTKPLAEDERIYSARFDGPRGFVVTFRQIDPLFAIDLSDPTNPRVTGELKIPGFSNYIHMMDKDHLLTIGKEDGALKISIFNVSDMENPTEVDNHILSGRFWSEASYDHKAFTYYKEKKLLAIPVTGYDYDYEGNNWWGRYSSQLKVFNVSPETKISEFGSINMTDIFTTREVPYNTWNRSARVSRSIFADDFVYAISDLGIKVANLNNLDTIESVVNFECDEKCFQSFGYYYFN